MFNNLARTLTRIALAAASNPHHSLPVPQAHVDTFTGRGKSGKHTHGKGNAAALKRASKKANNIRKYN